MCRNLAIMGVFVFCLTQLSGCSFVSRSHIGIDGPPDIDIDASKVADAVPKSEPYHPYHNGSRDYVVAGHRYHVLKTAKGYVKTGYASWYGSKFHGNETSTQERYNLYGMTAASTELPLPSYVQVTNLRNGKQVVVRVNDRGPFHSKRIIDLSYVAAKKLGFEDIGTAPVRVVGIDPKTWKKEPLPQPEPTKTKSSTKNKGIYLQVGAFTNQNNAKQLSTKLEKLTNKPTCIKRSNNLYRVHVGPIANSTQSDKLKNVLKENGFNKVVVVNN